VGFEMMLGFGGGGRGWVGLGSGEWGVGSGEKGEGSGRKATRPTHLSTELADVPLLVAEDRKEERKDVVEVIDDEAEEELEDEGHARKDILEDLCVLNLQQPDQHRQHLRLEVAVELLWRRLGSRVRGGWVFRYAQNSCGAWGLRPGGEVGVWVGELGCKAWRQAL
jgi:hypothetical protein